MPRRKFDPTRPTYRSAGIVVSKSSDTERSPVTASSSSRISLTAPRVPALRARRLAFLTLALQNIDHRQIVALARIEHRLVHHRARRYNPGYLALHQRFGLFRIFHLVATQRDVLLQQDAQGTRQGGAMESPPSEPPRRRLIRSALLR